MPMKRLEYRKVCESTREQALKDIATGRTGAVVEALLSLAYHDPDRRFVQELMIAHSGSPERNIRHMAILCFGHIARIHRELDEHRVMPILQAALKDPDPHISGTARDVLQDIGIYLQGD
jgi:hypothetical protein